MTKRRSVEARRRTIPEALAAPSSRYIIHNGQFYVLKAHMAKQIQLAIEMAVKSYAQRHVERSNQRQRCKALVLLQPGRTNDRVAHAPGEPKVAYDGR
jgi:hypothetical protein